MTPTNILHFKGEGKFIDNSKRQLAKTPHGEELLHSRTSE